MIYHLSLYFKQYAHIFNVLHYVSFRAIAALLSSLVFSFLFGNWFIEKSKLFFRSKARELTPDTHRANDGMPTGGGLFILSNVVFCSLLWANLGRLVVWLFLVCIICNGAVGFWDDWSK